MQRDWRQIRIELKAALSSYSGSITDLSTAAGIDYYSARRFIRKPPENQTESARRLCSFFNIDLFIHDKNLEQIIGAVNEVWDGSEDHARSLTALLRWSQTVNRPNSGTME